MIVVAGGMIRSGSTFAFNIVRELLALRGAVRSRSSTHVDPAEFDLPPTEHVVIKAHVPDPELLALIAARRLPCVCTIRRPEDAVASWMRTFGLPLENGTAMVKAWQAWHGQVRDRIATVDYSTIEETPGVAIEEIAAYLELDLQQAVLQRLVKSYDKQTLKRRLDALQQTEAMVDLGFSFYDPETFFHRRHISSDRPRSAEEDLTAEQIGQIRAALAIR